MSEHILLPVEGGPHVQHPARASVTRPVLDPRFYEPLVLLDLSVVDPALAGRRCLCLALTPSTCDEELEIEEQDDGTWTLVSLDGAPPADPTCGSRWAEPFAEGIHVFDDLPCFPAATLVPRPEDLDKARHVRLQLGAPSWVQSDDFPRGAGWIFVARLDSIFLFGSIFVFYHPETRRARHTIQLT